MRRDWIVCACEFVCFVVNFHCPPAQLVENPWGSVRYPANKQNRIKCATVAARVAASAVALMESVNLPMKSSQMTNDK